MVGFRVQLKLYLNMFKPVDTKVDFPALERKLLEEWCNKKIVGKYLHRNDSSEKRFSFLDGPITANNPMGVHHGWGRTYKDVWQRFYNMRGYKERFQNGFDCQGLWVEVEVEKELAIRTKKDIENIVPGDKKASIAKFVELCKERVLKFSAIQTEQSKRLGYFMDWDNSYYTMSDENNYMIWHFLKVCHEKGWIYKGKDSVPWCPRCETAISQHEMLTEDYKELTHETVFVKLPIVSKGWENTNLLIWTTTPWTVPANVAVAINTKFKYGVWEETHTKQRMIIIDKDEFGNTPLRQYKGKEHTISEYLFHDVEGKFEKVKEVSGKELIGLAYQAPFDFLPLVQIAKKENPNTFHRVVDGSEIVVSTEGTGLLHVAPGAGKEDFDLGKKEKLSIISPIDDTATYVNGMEGFSGSNAKKHPELIIDHLRHTDNSKYLLKSMHYTHRYPACWRCKTELVWKVAEEWYIAMDKQAKLKVKKENSKGLEGTLREQMIKTAKMIEWHPEFGLERELDWLANMHDWLISKKNRYWGLALPIYECKKCANFDVIGSKEELAVRAVKGWKKFDKHSPHKPYIDEVKIKCAKCDEIISRIDDVGNVWLDAGIVPFSTYIDPQTKKLSYTSDKKYWQQWFPAELITESFPGQFKNWFYSMIAMSTVLEKRNPFEKVLGYASVLAEDGRPMHKSWGNSIEFNEGADKMGVDVMRWMYVTADPEQNLLFGYKRADETRRRFHLMLWNIYNFFVLNANMDKWNPKNDVILSQAKDLDSSAAPQKDKVSQNVLDRWIMSRLNETIQIATNSLEALDARHASLSIEEFVSDLSLWYVRRSRERVGPIAENGEDKTAFYQTCWEVLASLSQLLSPFTPFLADEIYTNLTGEESVHLADWPSSDGTMDLELIENMRFIRKIVEMGLAKRKEKQVKVKQPLQKLQMMIPSTSLREKSSLNDQLVKLIKDELNVKEIEFKKGEELSVVLDTTITPELKAEGEAREIVRSIQEERKKLGTKLDEKVNVSLPSWPKDFEAYIKQHALIENIKKEKEISVSKLA